MIHTVKVFIFVSLLHFVCPSCRSYAPWYQSWPHMITLLKLLRPLKKAALVLRNLKKKKKKKWNVENSALVLRQGIPTVLVYEPPHDKTNRMSVPQGKTQISLGIRPVWSESSLCAQWVAKDPSFLHADSDWANAQANLSLRRAHTHFVGFVISRLIYIWYGKWLVGIYTWGS